jgi:hypothetical protein
MLQILRKDTQKKSAIRTAVNEGRWKVDRSVIDGYVCKDTFEVFFGLQGILKLEKRSFRSQTVQNRLHDFNPQVFREIGKWKR